MTSVHPQCLRDSVFLRPYYQHSDTENTERVKQPMKRLLFCFLCTAAFCATASAHIRDEYLQAALITLAPEGVRIELRLTPGVELADRVFAVIDTDHSGQLSSSEEQSYARRVVQDVSLELDGQHIPLALINIRFPSHPDMKDGTAAIQLDLSANAALNSPRDHQLSFRNNHLPKLSVYQANVLIPGNDAIEVTEQQRLVICCHSNSCFRHRRFS